MNIIENFKKKAEKNHTQILLRSIIYLIHESDIKYELAKIAKNLSKGFDFDKCKRIPKHFIMKDLFMTFDSKLIRLFYKDLMPSPRDAYSILCDCINIDEINRMCGIFLKYNILVNKNALVMLRDIIGKNDPQIVFNCELLIRENFIHGGNKQLKYF